MEEINVFNLYEHVVLEFENNILKISWDNTNPILNSLMLLESQPYLVAGENTMYSCKWVGDVKKHMSWEVGKPIHIHIQHYVKGIFWVYIYNKPQDRLICEKIDENGYLIATTHTFHESYYCDLVRVNCYYNDLLDEEDIPYTLK